MTRLVLGLLLGLMLAQPANAFFFYDYEKILTQEKERRCMAEAIYHESKSESRQGKIAVGHVVLNRVKSGRYSDSICGVVYQKNYKARGCQFTWACRKNARIVYKHLWEEALQIAEEVMDNKHQDYSRGAIAFNNAPFRNMKLTVKIGNHYFYTNRKS